MNRFAAFALSFMVSCAPIPQEAPPSRAMNALQALPPMKAFGSQAVTPAMRPNSEIAQDFLDLTFRMENGKAIPAMTRFQGPITVRIAGPAPASMTRDLRMLLARLRREAGIPITLTDGPSASITVEAVPQAVLQKAVPRAACFVVPRITSWQEYAMVRRTSQVDWTTLTRRDRAVIFVPADVAPQEIRDCLH